MRICAWFLALLACAGASPSAPPSAAVVAAADALTRASVAIADAPPTLDCEACEFVLAVYVEIAGNATTLREFTELFESACGVIAPGLPVVQDVCDAVISALMSGVVPFLDEQLTTLAWDIPKVFCAVFIPVCFETCCITPTAPEQVRLALTNKAGEMSVTWTTLNDTLDAAVQWGTTSGGALPNVVPAYSHTYALGGWLGVFHSSTLSGLPSGMSISYRVGSDASGWSSVRNFSTLPSNAGSAARPLRLIHIGDMGWGDKSNDTIARVGALIGAGSVDGILHTGDVSYADGQQHSWDVFMRKVEAITSSTFYMVTPGNHEQVWWGGAPYRARWLMPPALDASGAPLPPSVTENRSYYALNLGGIGPSSSIPALHVSMIDTESVLDTGDVPPHEQAWLKADLATTAAFNSSWRIVGGHRPLYCTNGGYGSSNKDCGPEATNLRAQAEAILLSAKVDLTLTAHMHGYERSLPVADGKVVNGGSYSSPAAPVHVVNGAGGNRESNDDPRGNAPWSAPSALPPALTHTATIGFGVMTIVGGEPAGGNSLRYQFYESATGTLLDDFTITK